MAFLPLPYLTYRQTSGRVHGAGWQAGTPDPPINTHREVHVWPAGDTPRTDPPDTPHNPRGCPRMDVCRLPLHYLPFGLVQGSAAARHGRPFEGVSGRKKPLTNGFRKCIEIKGLE